jgi:RND family efflux transporter MFP subunit
MTNELNTQSTPTEVARQQWQAAARRRPAAGYVLVAAIALASGIGGTLLAGRYTAGRKSAEPPVATTGQHAEDEATMSATAAPADKAVYISPARQQLIGVRTAEVAHRALETTIRTVGVLAYDETRVAEIHTKVAGWVDRVQVDFVGKAVRRGQPLFSVYSPDLVSTQKEYLLALKAQAQLADSRFAETREGATSLLEATRERLRLWDISDKQVAELAETGQTRRTLTLYSPYNGVVLERNAFPGQYITPEMSTFKIADLSTIWVLGQIFEYEQSMVKLGQEAEIQFPYGQSTRTLKGRITYIYPEVDAMTRRVKVRVAFRNPGFEFRPESYVTVVIRSGAGHQLAVPKEAVIDTGERRYAIVARENGYFEPREIEVGEPVDEFLPVRAGLEPGDRAVVSAQFLIDSETNLQAAMQSIAGMHGSMEMGTGGGGQEGMTMPDAKPGAPDKQPDHSGHQPSAPKPGAERPKR